VTPVKGATPASAAPTLVTSGLTKAYMSGAVALAPLDLSVEAGERVSLIGHNGSGKTTLIRLLAGLLDPTDGTATIGGHVAGTPAARRALSYLGDQPVFYEDLSVREHLEYVARLHDTPDWEDRADRLLDAIGLTARAGDLPATFSRGLKQKAAICIAFVRPFEVLVVDEPFVGLDSAGRTALLGLLADAHAAGATLLVATHELTTIGASQRVIALRDGEVAYDGPAGDADVSALVAS
jgi:ABC-type multidrug transport system ATPase subunit